MAVNQLNGQESVVSSWYDDGNQVIVLQHLLDDNNPMKIISIILTIKDWETILWLWSSSNLKKSIDRILVMKVEY